MSDLAIDLNFEPEIQDGVLEPSKLLIYGLPKTGKSTIAAALPNSLLIDLEGGAGFLRAVKQDVKKESIKRGMHPIAYYNALAETIKKKNAELGKPAYDFIIIDPITVLESMAMSLAANEYKKSVQGKNWTGSNIIKDVAQGGGYEWLRDAFERLYKVYEGLAGKAVIYIGHVKLTSIAKEGTDISAKDISLVGKGKILISSDMDAIGYLYRDIEQKSNILSFVTEEQDLVSGSRIPSLANKKVVISKSNEDGSVTTFWENIFPSIKK